ncbi:MAG: type IV secretory system conjugative DNA transfer family protein [Flavobacteriales bacterium]
MKTFFSFFFGLLKGIFKVLFWIIRFLLNLPNTKSKLYDSSFMKVSTKKKLLSTSHTGVCVNGKLKLNEEKSKIHSLIIGRTGVGKTTIFNLNNVLDSNDKVMVISDMDAGIYNRSSGYLKSIGYNILTFDLLNTNSSCFYNPIYFCETNDDLKTLAKQIIDAGSGEHSKEVFWNNSATNLLFFLLKLVKTQPEQFQNLVNVRQLLLLLELEGFDEFVSNQANDELWLEYLSIKAQESKLRSNITATLSSVLDLLSYEEIGYITSKNTLDFSLLLNPKTVIYVIIPEHKISQYSLLISMFYNQLFSYLQKNKPEHIVYAFLDEMPQYKITDIQVLQTTLRRYNVSLNCSIQDYKQLEYVYGEKVAATIFSNSASKLIFPGCSLELAKKMSQICGTETVEIEYQDKTTQNHKPLITPTEIIQMSSDESLFFHGNLAPLKLKTFPYFQNSTLNKRSKIPSFERETHQFSKPPLISISGTTSNPTDYEGFDEQSLS